MMCFLLVSAAVLTCLVHIEALPSGAPQAACLDMVPQHYGVVPQTSPAPYTLNVAAGNGGYQVEVVADDVPFKGVFLQARVEGDTVALGVWAAEDDENLQLISCPEGSDGNMNALTHTNNTEKTSLSAVWMPVDGEAMATKIQMTVVQSFNTLWVGVETTIPDKT